MSVDMSKMIGPLPAGAWFAVVAGGLGIMVYTKKQSASAAAASAGSTIIPTDPTTDSGTGGSGMWTDLTVPTTGASGVSTITTNDDWSRAAINYLIGAGYDASIADSAIRKYMATDQSLSAQEYAMVTAALMHLGAPPIPLPPPLFGPTATTGGGLGTGSITIPPPTGRGSAPGTFIVPGGFNQKVSLRTIAASLTTDKSPNAVQTQLIKLVKANPGLIGKTYALGGHVLNRPA